MCLSINDTYESIASNLKTIAICVVILTIVLIAIKYGITGDSEPTGQLRV